MTHAPTGAIVAAPTTSLPEVLGGKRNWDYRFAWVRDSSFSSRAFAEVGCEREAGAFRAFIMRSAAGYADDLQVVYGVGGERRLGASELDGLEGYRGSQPVRIGNAASSTPTASWSTWPGAGTAGAIPRAMTSGASSSR
jgi:GH15 family glucan-1,4-alpha-glucosidase